jgi:hypothetical protein
MTTGNPADIYATATATNDDPPWLPGVVVSLPIRQNLLHSQEKDRGRT